MVRNPRSAGRNVSSIRSVSVVSHASGLSGHNITAGLIKYYNLHSVHTVIVFMQNISRHNTVFQGECSPQLGVLKACNSDSDKASAHSAHTHD